MQPSPAVPFFVVILHLALFLVMSEEGIPRCYLLISGTSRNLLMGPYDHKKWREIKEDGNWGGVTLKKGSSDHFHFFDDTDEDEARFKCEYDEKKKCIPNGQMLHSWDGSFQWPKTYNTVIDSPNDAPYLGLIKAMSWKLLGSGGHFNSFTKCYEAGIKSMTRDRSSGNDAGVGVQWHYSDDTCNVAFANDGRYLKHPQAPIRTKFIFHHTKGRGSLERSVIFQPNPAPGTVPGPRHHIPMEAEFSVRECGREAQRKTVNAKFVVVEDSKCYATTGTHIEPSTESSPTSFFLKLIPWKSYCLNNKKRHADCVYCHRMLPTANALDTVYDLCCSTAFYTSTCKPLIVT